MYTIQGSKDIAGGHLMTDRRSATNSTLGKCFTTLCYSADGSYILVAGSSKYICMYDVADQTLPLGIWVNGDHLMMKANPNASWLAPPRLVLVCTHFDLSIAFCEGLRSIPEALRHTSLRLRFWRLMTTQC
ncbi:hypothetical protein VNO77_14200 [Canavalia gladiata]|uniref:Uncharacterized protein n=1 Tax=Canavalia gladiata TaxID=3824 RepID=A0AAN9LYH9_CANGL